MATQRTCDITGKTPAKIYVLSLKETDETGVQIGEAVFAKTVDLSQRGLDRALGFLNRAVTKPQRKAK